MNEENIRHQIMERNRQITQLQTKLQQELQEAQKEYQEWQKRYVQQEKIQQQHPIPTQEDRERRYNRQIRKTMIFWLISIVFVIYTLFRMETFSLLEGIGNIAISSISLYFANRNSHRIDQLRNELEQENYVIPLYEKTEEEKELEYARKRTIELEVLIDEIKKQLEELSKLQDKLMESTKTEILGEIKEPKEITTTLEKGYQLVKARRENQDSFHGQEKKK